MMSMQMGSIDYYNPAQMHNSELLKEMIFAFERTFQSLLDKKGQEWETVEFKMGFF